MRAANILLISLILCLTQSAGVTTLNASKASQHFLAKFKKQLDFYTFHPASLQKENQSVHHERGYVVTNGVNDIAHVIDINFHEGEAPRFELSNGKLNAVSKTLHDGYIVEEMEMHWETFTELVKRQVYADFGTGDAKIFYNTVQDVKDVLSKTKKNYKQVVVEETVSVNNSSELSFRVLYQKSLVMLLSVSISEPLISTQRISSIEKKDWNLRVTYMTSVDDSETTHEILIPVFTSDAKEFENKMEPIREALDYKLFINTRLDVENNVQKFVGKMSIGEGMTRSTQEDSEVFSLKTETGEAKILVKELPQGQKNLPFFSVTVCSDKKANVLKFKRLRVDALAKKMNQINFNEFIKSIYQEIMEAFKQHYEKYTLAKFSSSTLKEIAPREEKGVVVQNGANDLIRFEFEENNKVIKLKFIAKEVNLKHTHTFVKSMYNIQIVSTIIETLIKTHLTIIDQSAKRN